MTDTLTREQLATTRSAYIGIEERLSSSIQEFELREIPNGTGGTDLQFTGYACVTGATYEMEDWMGPWDESVEAGAFAKTLSEDPDVQFRVNHQGLLLARTKPGTLKLAEDGVGLNTDARLDPKNPQVVALRSAVERGDLDEMSFAFRVKRQEWDEDYTRRWIREVDINHGDVSPVNFGANPATGGTVSIRSRRGGTPEPTSADRLIHELEKLHRGEELSDEQLRRLLALQPVAEARGAIAYVKTGTSDAAWDGPANEKNLSNSEGASTYRKAFAWVDSDKDADTKTAYAFIHHFVSSDGDVGDASTVACSSGIAVLNGGRGGSSSADWWGDRKGIYDHLAGHLKAAGKDVPDLKDMTSAPDLYEVERMKARLQLIRAA